MRAHPVLCYLVLLLAATGPQCAAAGTFAGGRVVAVHDGDTITVLDAGHHQHRIRLYQIDAPEKGQDYGTASKRSLSQLIAGRQVSVVGVATDRYDREVATVYLAGKDINLEQVRRGMAWVYRRYANDPHYLDVEQLARAARVGLWARSSPVPPWEFRREHRSHDNSGFSGWLKRLW